MRCSRVKWSMAVLLVVFLVASLSLAGGAFAQPPTQVLVSPPAQTVAPGQTFTVNISVVPGEPIAGVQFNLAFDASRLTANSVVEGNLLKQGGASTIFAAGTINNAAGTINNTYGFITTPGQSVIGPGVFATVSFTAKASLGLSPLNLSSVVVGRPNGTPVIVQVTNGSVTVEQIYTLTITSTDCGAVTVPGEGQFPYPAGTQVNLVATPDGVCCYFVNWSGPVANPGSAQTTITMNGNYAIQANFARYHYTLTANADPPAGGTATGGGVYDCCTTVQVTATPTNACWYFVNWTGDVANPQSPTTTTHIGGDKTVTAHFARYQYALTVNASPPQGGTVTGGGTYDCCTTVPVTATPADGCWHFVSWTGDVASPNLAQTTTHVGGVKTVTANFALSPAWDVNCDGCVNVLDVILVGQAFDSQGPPCWIRQDVNCDGVINVLDVILIGQHFGEGCPV